MQPICDQPKLEHSKTRSNMRKNPLWGRMRVLIHGWRDAMVSPWAERMVGCWGLGGLSGSSFWLFLGNNLVQIPWSGLKQGVDRRISSGLLQPCFPWLCLKNVMKQIATKSQERHFSPLETGCTAGTVTSLWREAGGGLQYLYWFLT